jgi:hypothetical protein
MGWRRRMLRSVRRKLLRMRLRRLELVSKSCLWGFLSSHPQPMKLVMDGAPPFLVGAKKKQVLRFAKDDSKKSKSKDKSNGGNGFFAALRMTNKKTEQQQIPFGNDSKKNNSNSRFPSGMTARKTRATADPSTPLRCAQNDSPKNKNSDKSKSSAGYFAGVMPRWTSTWPLLGSAARSS